jgi:uncharacterized protein (TIGR02147 family)
VEKPSIFEHKSFRDYIEERLKCDDFGRGGKAKLAAYLECQPSFISQVLKGKNNLSLEQGYKINSLFSHSHLEKDYFINLLEHDRAGSLELRKYFEMKLEDIKEKAKLIENHIEFEHLSEEDTIAYYDNWNHVLAHQLINIPKYQTVNALRQKLNIDDDDLKKTLSFLSSCNLIDQDEVGNLKMGTSRLHIRKGSPLADFANKTARLHNIQNLKRKDASSLNYGAYMTLSKKNYLEFKQRFVNLISELHNSLDEDEPETVCSIIIDMMEL